MERRDVLTMILALPFVASMPYLLPADAAAPIRLGIAALYLAIGTVVARYAATRLTR